jgi:hypothetical protein
MKQKIRSLEHKMWILSGFILMLTFSGHLRAQKSQAEYRQHNRRVLNAKIILQNGNLMEGKYLAVNDSIIWLIRPGVETDSVYKFHFTEIESITMHRKGNFLRGFAVGFGLTSVGSAALALSIENIGFFTPAAIYFLTEAVIGLPISAAIGLVDAYHGKSIYTPMEGKPEDFKKLTEALKEENKYATTRKTEIVKQPTYNEKAQVNQSKIKPENTAKDTLTINKSHTAMAKHQKQKAFHFVASKKNIESPLMFNLKIVRGNKHHHGNRQLGEYWQGNGFEHEPNSLRNKNLWNFDLSVPLKNKMYAGISREYKFSYINTSFKQTNYTNQNSSNLYIRASSQQLIPYLAMVNKNKNTLNPSGMQFSIRSGLIIERGQYLVNSYSSFDGEGYFDEYSQNFGGDWHVKLGLQLQATTEYYFYENFSIVAGAAAELKSPVKIKPFVIAQESYTPIVLEEYQLNLSNIYIFGGIGIHF